MTKKHIIIGSVILIALLLFAAKIVTYDPRPAVVQAAEEELQDLLPRYRQAEAEFNALKAEKERNEKTLKDYHFSFDEETLRAVEGELPLE
jgi:hypothetical protein